MSVGHFVLSIEPIKLSCNKYFTASRSNIHNLFTKLTHTYVPDDKITYGLFGLHS